MSIGVLLLAPPSSSRVLPFLSSISIGLASAAAYDSFSSHLRLVLAQLLPLTFSTIAGDPPLLAAGFAAELGENQENSQPFTFGALYMSLLFAPSVPGTPLARLFFYLSPNSASLRDLVLYSHSS